MTTASTPSLLAPGGLTALFREAARRLFLDRQADFWLSELDASWSHRELRARVVGIHRETPDTLTFELRPNALWREHRAGQFVTLSLEIDGARVQRCYSLSCPPGRDTISVTVKRVPGGLVSNWMHDHVRVGDTLVLDRPAGEFVVPHPVPERLLFVAGGSGITPILAMLEDLAERGAAGLLADAVLVDYARSADDIIARERLERLADACSGLSVRFVLDDDPTGPGRFEPGHFRALVPDFAERDTWLCGPAGLMDAAAALFSDAGAGARLRCERFALPAVAGAQVAETAAKAAPLTIALTKAQLQLAGIAAGTLLEQLEHAGRRPAHGCRMGICRTCRCRKRSGVVQNVLTGELSEPGEQDIQLCISVPRSDVELEL